MRSFLYRCVAFAAAFVTVLIVGLIAAGPVLAREAVDPEVHEDSDVVVTASRYDNASRLNITNITAAELEYREPDLELPMLLNGVPGVFAYSDAGNGLGYTYLKIRGFDQRRVGVLFGGIPMNDPEDHQIWWVNLPDLAASVQDIQVQRGVTNSIGGMTAIGGTVNIEPIALQKTKGGALSFDAGSYGFNRQMLSYQTGDLGSGLSSCFRISRQETDGYRERAGNEGWSVFWSGQWETARSTTRVNLFTGHEVTRHAWDAVPESVLEVNRRANMETYHNAIDNFRQPHYELHNEYHFSDGLTLTNRLYYIHGEGYYENFKDDETAAAYSLDRLPGVAPDDELDLIRQKWVRKDHTGWVPSLRWEQGFGRLLVGGDWYTFHSTHWGDVMWAEGFTPTDFVEGYKYHDYNGDKQATSLYANQQWRAARGLLLTADIHFQHKRYAFRQNEVKNFAGDLLNEYAVDWDFFNPKFHVNWTVPGRVVGGGMQAYGSVGRNHREPTDNELYDTWTGADDLGVQPLFHQSRNVLNDDGSVAFVNWSDPYMQPEQVTDYELGIGWQNPTLSFTLGAYYMDFRDEIVPYGGVNDDGSSIRGNAERSVHKGLELGLRLRVDANNDLSVAASRSWDTFKDFLFHDWDGSVYDYAGNPVALFPEHLVQVAWDTRWSPAARTRIRVRNTGKQYLDNSGDESRIIDPWTTLDLSFWLDLGAAGLRPLAGASVFVHARNIGDTEYETWGYWYGENYYTPAAGRNYAFGVDYRF